MSSAYPQSLHPSNTSFKVFEFKENLPASSGVQSFPEVYKPLGSFSQGFPSRISQPPR